MSKPVLTHVVYRPKPGGEARLRDLVQGHWPILHRLGLSTDDPAQIYVAHGKRT